MDNDDAQTATQPEQQQAQTQITQNVNRRIKALSREVIDKIAAGEVVQRPANAIKELLENSLDAGATSITITVLEGGLKLLQIIDNGHGIARDDLEVVCHRHTTSKLNTYEDLRTIGTFGFRGEALASVSQVSTVSIRSKTEEQRMAYEAEYTAKGDLKPNFPRACAGTKGTIITVKDLFYNMTQRRKGMSGTTEHRRVVDVVQKYALHNTGISITLKRQGESKPDVHTSMTKNIAENIRAIFTARLAKELLNVEHTSEKLGFSFSTYFSNTNYHEKAMTFILFINKRLVECKNLKSAVKEIFEPYLPKKSYPFVYISLQMEAKNVDVNVHPTKEEVGFLKESEIISEIQEEMKKKLMGGNDSRVFVANSVTPLTNKVSQSAGEAPAFFTSSNVITQKTQRQTLPQHTVRVDTINQTGQMEAYLKSQSNKRPLPDEEFKPVKRMRPEENPIEYASVNKIVEALKRDSNDELISLFKNCTYVGWVNSQLSLIQHETRLYVVDVQTISISLIHQQVFHHFGRFRKIMFSEPLDLFQLILTAVQNEHAENNMEDVDSTKDEEETKTHVQTLCNNAGMLADYFKIEIQDEKLLGIPQILANHSPPLHRLPIFLFSLARIIASHTRTKEDEQDVLYEIAVQLALFYSLSYDWELDQQPKSTNALISDLTEKRRLASFVSSYNEDSLKWVTQHVVFPACRLFFYPPKDFATDGTVREIAHLSELYKVFERC